MGNLSLGLPRCHCLNCPSFTASLPFSRLPESPDLEFGDKLRSYIFAVGYLFKIWSQPCLGVKKAGLDSLSMGSFCVSEWEGHIWLLSGANILLPLDKHIFTALCLRNDPAWKMLTWEGGLADIRDWPGSLWVALSPFQPLTIYNMPPAQSRNIQYLTPATNISKFPSFLPPNMSSHVKYRSMKNIFQKWF